ncbi:MAG TPA: hypothetical protein VMU27_02020 [Candidatus Paceibacterota bacterium]|nr:hypothetical protein [Candidatus Paceibacterota bacterium]
MNSTYTRIAQLANRYDWVFALFLAAIGVHYTELFYRVQSWDAYMPLQNRMPLDHHLWLYLLYCEPLYIIAGIGFFWGFHKAPTFLSAWAVFIFFVTISRLIITASAGEAWNMAVVLGLALVVLGLLATACNKTAAKNLPLDWKARHALQRREDTIEAAITIAIALVATPAIWFYIGELLEVLTVKWHFGWWMLELLIAATCIAMYEYSSRTGVMPIPFLSYSPWLHEIVQKYFLLKFLQYFPIELRFFPLRIVRVPITKAQWLPLMPLAIATNLCLMYGYRYAEPTFVFAWAVYNIYDVVLRVINNTCLGEPFRFIHALGMAVIVYGTYLTLFGGH